MTLAPLAQWAVFAVFSLIAVAGALGMTTTMGMFRSAIFLMASFIGVAGLFILLLADLIGMLQVMMYIGGMLVMALFMVLFSSDPGGAMMASHMDLKLFEKLFSLGLAGRGEDGGGHDEGDGDMSMFTPAKKLGFFVAPALGVLLCAALLWRPSWPVVEAVPDQDSARRIGHLLMSRYMIAFEGAGLLILLGLFGAVYVARPGRHPDPTDRDALQAAVDAAPPEIEGDGEGEAR